MKKLTALSLTVATYLVAAQSAYAGTNINFCPVATDNSNFESLCSITFDGNLVSALVTIAFIVATLLALAFLIFGGVKWITSGGDKANVESARNMIVAALVGLVIVFLSYFILNLILGFFGITTEGGAFTLPSLSG